MVFTFDIWQGQYNGDPRSGAKGQQLVDLSPPPLLLFSSLTPHPFVEVLLFPPFPRPFLKTSLVGSVSLLICTLLGTPSLQETSVSHRELLESLRGTLCSVFVRVNLLRERPVR